MIITTKALAPLLLSLTALTAPLQVEPPSLQPHRPIAQSQMLVGNTQDETANKRLVYEFWREVIEARHLDRAEHYLHPNYIQHNPNVGQGRDAFIAFFSTFGPPVAISPTVQAPLISIMAEGDLVMLSFTTTLTTNETPATAYQATWFDMFRIQNGRIVEHWDSATMSPYDDNRR